MNRAFYLICFCLFTLQVQAQLPEPKSQFSIGLLNGVNRSSIEETSINGYHFSPAIAFDHSLQFRYRYWFHPRWYAELGLGAGFQGFRQKNPLNATMIFWDYAWIGQTRTEFQAAFNLFSNGNKSLNLPFGAGWNRSDALTRSSSTYSPEGNSTSQFTTNHKIKPYILFGLEFQVRNKRQDALSFQVFYQQGFQSILQGTYSTWINGESAFGAMQQRNTGVYLGLAYTFTRARKVDRINELKTTGSLSNREARQLHKKEKRYIDPKSTFVSIGVGVANAQNTVKTNNSRFQNSGFGSFQSRIAFEKGIKNSFFWEAEYNNFEFWHVTELKDVVGKVGSNAFYGHFLQAGFGYRVQSKKTNLQFFNLHAGIGLGARFTPNNYSSSSSSINFDGNSNVTHVISDTSYLVGRFMPIAYIGISKDIRITEKLALTLQFKQQLGMNAVSRTDQTYQSSVMPIPETSYTVLNGTARSLQFGLKYLIRPKLKSQKG